MACVYFFKRRFSIDGPRSAPGSFEKLFSFANRRSWADNSCQSF
jgi:hypothetical protein